MNVLLNITTCETEHGHILNFSFLGNYFAQVSFDTGYLWESNNGWGWRSFGWTSIANA